MKISVITPFKNSKPWLDRCAKSMYENDGDFEFIFVDDHSNDGGWEILEGYELKDDRFVMLNNMHSPGVSGARNTGLDAATGEYIAFVDADDELVENTYKNIIKELKTTANIHQFNHQRQYEKTGEIVVRYKSPSGWYHLLNLPLRWVIIWNKVYRRAFLNGIYFDETMKFGEDELFNLECLAKDPVIHCSDDIITRHHFDNKNSLTKTKTKEDLFKETVKLQEFIDRQTDPKLRKQVCQMISLRWGSNIYIKTMGGEIDET